MQIKEDYFSHGIISCKKKKTNVFLSLNCDAQTRKSEVYSFVNILAEFTNSKCEQYNVIQRAGKTLSLWISLLNDLMEKFPTVQCII